MCCYASWAWVILQQAHKQAFLDHINSIDAAIKFTEEGTQENGATPFLDTLRTPQADNSLSISVPQANTYWPIIAVGQSS